VLARALTLLVLTPALAAAEPVVHLRFAAIAPDGTAWAREIRAFVREIESASNGRITMKFYLNGIAGDDLEIGARMRRDQLDGALSAGMLCQEAAPSMAVFRIPGMIQDRDEASHVLSRILPSMREQAGQHGMTLLSAAPLGKDVITSRVPIENLEGLRKLKIWIWDLDHAAIAYAQAMGLKVVALPVADAGRAYEEGRIDGFMGIPSAILGYQWFAKQLFMSQLPLSVLPGCVLMTAKSFDQLPAELQAVVRNAAAKAAARFADVTRVQDDQLLGGVFQRQGVRTVPVSGTFAAEFLAATRDARDRVGEKVVPKELLLKVQSMLADYRAEHH
jgi:TRAP-type C4-dicarboxylate transport system substrate-binding protein